MIEIRQLQFAFAHGGFRLAIDNLRIEQGERVAIVGPSGSGKTTLLHLLAGVYRADSGEIRVGDTRVHSLSDAARRDFRIANIGLVFQEFELVEYLNVRDNIVLPFLINKRLKLTSSVRAEGDRLAESLGLGDKLKRRIHKLSHGERQRVAVCRALLPRPALLLADEPTGSLDPSNKDHLLDLLVEMAAQSNATLVVVTHDHGLLDRFDRVIDFRDFQAVE